MIRLFPILLALLTSLSTASEFRFIAFDFGIPSGSYSIIRDVEEDKPKPVEIGINRFSERIKLAPGNYRLLDPEAKEAARFSSLEGAEPQLMIVLPDGKDGIALFPAPDSAKRFGPGDRLLINATPGNIRIMLGERKILLKPGGSSVEKIEVDASDPRIPVRMFCEDEGAWKIFTSTMWPHDPMMRSIVLIHPPIQGNSFPRVRSIAELAVIQEDD